MPITPRQAARLVIDNGGRFWKHGARHDLYQSKDGKVIAIPRHAADLSLGVERDIRKKLGL